MPETKLSAKGHAGCSQFFSFLFSFFPPRRMRVRPLTLATESIATAYFPPEGVLIELNGLPPPSLYSPFSLPLSSLSARRVAFPLQFSFSSSLPFSSPPWVNATRFFLVDDAVCLLEESVSRLPIGGRHLHAANSLLLLFSFHARGS